MKLNHKLLELVISDTFPVPVQQVRDLARVCARPAAPLISTATPASDTAMILNVLFGGSRRDSTSVRNTCRH